MLAALGAALSGACVAPPTRAATPPPPEPAAPPPPPPLASPAAADAGVATAPAPLPDPPGPLLPAILADSVNRFAGDLYGTLAAQKGNLFCSPLGISVALTMASAGARGKTADEMAKVLHLDPKAIDAHAAYKQLLARLQSKPKDGAPELAVANRLWADNSAKLAPAFVALTQNDYGAAVAPLDFRGAPEPARQTINQWVSDRTHQRIDQLLSAGSIDASTRLVLTNAIYMKARWANPFSHTATRDETFYVGGVKGRKVPMMHLGGPGQYAEIPGAAIVELPYTASQTGARLSMRVVLPTTRTGLAAVERTLAKQGLGAFTGALATRNVTLSLPRFRAKLAFALKPALEKLGMTTAFSDAADFSGIAEPSLQISDVFHQAFVATDEDGTEAAAATAVVMRATSALIAPHVEFRADHPFLVLIRDASSGVVLFVGRITDPGT